VIGSWNASSVISRSARRTIVRAMCSSAEPGQHEGRQRLKRGVALIDRCFEPGGLRLLQAERLDLETGALRPAKVGADVEQIILNAGQDGTHRFRDMARGPADKGVGLIDRAGGRDPDVELRQSGAVAEHSAPVIARAGVHAVYLDHGEIVRGEPSGLPGYIA
jgi:hypothetical protein